jgi:hypothetical protein
VIEYFSSICEVLGLIPTTITKQKLYKRFKHFLSKVYKTRKILVRHRAADKEDYGLNPAWTKY